MFAGVAGGGAMDLVDLARRPFADVAPAISGSVAYMDEGAGECAHHCAGAGFILSLGAVNVLSLNASRAPSRRPRPRWTSRGYLSSANAGRDLQTRLRRGPRATCFDAPARTPRRERHVLCAVSEEAHVAAAHAAATASGDPHAAQASGHPTSDSFEILKLAASAIRPRARMAGAGDQVPEETGRTPKNPRGAPMTTTTTAGASAGGDGWGDDWGETDLNSLRRTRAPSWIERRRRRALDAVLHVRYSRCPSPRCLEALPAPAAEPPRPPPSRPPTPARRRLAPSIAVFDDAPPRRRRRRGRSARAGPSRRRRPRQPAVRDGGAHGREVRVLRAGTDVEGDRAGYCGGGGSRGWLASAAVGNGGARGGGQDGGHAHAGGERRGIPAPRGDDGTGRGFGGGRIGRDVGRREPGTGSRRGWNGLGTGDSIPRCRRRRRGRPTNAPAISRPRLRRRRPRASS